jgi:general secretion pathway protein D
MRLKKRIDKIFILVTLCAVILGGCAGEKTKPPYFKDIYESSIKNGKVETEEVAKDKEHQDISSDDTKSKSPEAIKPVVKLITIPNPLKRETVIAVSKDKARRDTKQAPEEESKPIEISTQAAAGDVQVVVENMPLYDFTNMVFGEILKLNYTISEDVSKSRERITLNMNRKMTGKEFFPFVVDLLRKNNLDISEENGMVYARRKDQQTVSGVQSSEIYVGSFPPGLSPQKRITLIVSTNYVAASQILQVIRQLQLMSSDIKAEVLAGTQTLVLNGTVTALSRVVGLFDELDRFSFINHDFNLVYFDYINVMDFNKKMREVLSSLGIPLAKSTSDIGLLTIPFEKINALLVVSPRKEWLDLLLFWKDKLDAVESMGEEMQMFVYHPKNRAANELVDILKAVSGGSSSAAPTSAETSATPTALAARNAQKNAAAAAAAAAGVTSIPTKGGFSAILDKGRNGVIVSASPSNYKLIRNILVQLDTPPRQVLIEATIMEVTLNDQFQFGVEWFIKHSLSTSGAGSYDGTISTLGGLGLGGAGLNYAISKIGGDFQANLNMYAKKNLINVISTPHIVMLDGKEATINVGTEVPIVTSETSAADLSGSSTSSSGTTTPSIMRNVQYRNTGVILRVKPVINSDGALTIDVSQELSEAQNNTVSSIDSPLILNRSINTTLAVNSGETVLLGGLISSNKSTGESKVPFFGDIPLIGHLFKTQSVGTAKTELIVEITPYILNDLDQLNEITKKFRDTMFTNQ